MIDKKKLTSLEECYDEKECKKLLRAAVKDDIELFVIITRTGQGQFQKLTSANIQTILNKHPDKAEVCLIDPIFNHNARNFDDLGHRQYLNYEDIWTSNKLLADELLSKKNITSSEDFLNHLQIACSASPEFAQVINAMTSSYHKYWLNKKDKDERTISDTIVDEIVTTYNFTKTCARAIDTLIRPSSLKRGGNIGRKKAKKKETL